jgi:hypothetical protein
LPPFNAAYLVRELGGDLKEEDLVALGEHRCYARLSIGGARPPAFSVELDPPPETDDKLARILAGRSAARYGRDPDKVAAARKEALERLAAAEASSHPPSTAGGASAEQPPAAHGGGRRRRARSPRPTGDQTPAADLQTPLFAADDVPDARAEDAEPGGQPSDGEPAA